MLTATLTILTEALLKAQLLAIQTLTKILETAEDPKELRRAATTLLKLKLPSEPPSPATRGGGGGGDFGGASEARIGGGMSPPYDPRSEIRDPRSQPHHYPLLPTELADLRTLFPDVAVTHFTKTHSPPYWRGIIFR